SATNRLHSGAACAGRTQQTQELGRGGCLAHPGVCPGNEKAHATCFARSDVVRFALIACTIDRKIFVPSMLPSRASEARSGWGIRPKTFRSRLQIPAMFSIEPFGLASGRMRPRLSAYRKITCRFALSSRMSLHPRRSNLRRGRRACEEALL